MIEFRTNNGNWSWKKIKIKRRKLCKIRSQNDKLSLIIKLCKIEAIAWRRKLLLLANGNWTNPRAADGKSKLASKRVDNSLEKKRPLRRLVL